MGPCIVNVFSSMTNKTQRCIILFIAVNALHVSGGFSRSSSGAQICTCSIKYLSNLFAVTASVDESGLQCQLIHASGSSKQA
jgi:hypothetical protein